MLQPLHFFLDSSSGTHDKAYGLRLVKTTIGIPAANLARAVTRSRALSGVGDASANQKARRLFIPVNVHLSKPTSNLDYKRDYGGPDPNRNSRVKFTRRSYTLKTKAHELAKFCDTDIYLVINHQRGSFVYNLVDNKLWPPSDKKLEQKHPNLERSNFSKMESLSESSESRLSRLTRYFAARSERFRSLENLYRKMDPANIVADKEALKIVSPKHDHGF
ncbi:hypothetical protein N7501_010594 [Penicillium viridicatum]|nr:hypothetical protein N7501_010594 [Penicillium viridicatum]